MHRLIEKDPRNAERIFPYLGGEEVNNSPTHSHHRYAINFEGFPLDRDIESASWQDADDRQRRDWLRAGSVPDDYPGAVAADWPDLLATVMEKVRSERLMDNRENYRRLWWQFAERRPGLASELSRASRALVISRVSQMVAFVFVATNIVPAETTVAIVLEQLLAFCVLQSRPHEIWARFMASSLEDWLRYAPTDCFETFPFPANYEINPAAEIAGKTYYEFRADVMVRNNERITKTYNRFHRPDEYSPDILKLRELHDAMDRAVLDAYGWHDLQPVCEFFPEFDDEDDEDSESTRPRQKRYRYRWPDDIHDEVLARLLALNRERAGIPAEPIAAPPRTPRKSARPKKAVPPDQSKLF